ERRHTGDRSRRWAGEYSRNVFSGSQLRALQTRGLRPGDEQPAGGTCSNAERKTQKCARSRACACDGGLRKRRAGKSDVDRFVARRHGGDVREKTSADEQSVFSIPAAGTVDERAFVGAVDLAGLERARRNSI